MHCVFQSIKRSPSDIRVSADAQRRRCAMLAQATHFPSVLLATDGSEEWETLRTEELDHDGLLGFGRSDSNGEVSECGFHLPYLLFGRCPEN